MIDIKTGDVVLLQSGTWRDSYAVAVVGDRITDKRVGLRKILFEFARDEPCSVRFYGETFDRKPAGLEAEALRDRKAILSVFPKGTDPHEAYRVHHDLRAKRNEAHKKATWDYYAKSKAFSENPALFMMEKGT